MAIYERQRVDLPGLSHEFVLRDIQRGRDRVFIAESRQAFMVSRISARDAHKKYLDQLAAAFPEPFLRNSAR